jgi:hypothetical protein
MLKKKWQILVVPLMVGALSVPFLISSLAQTDDEQSQLREKKKRDDLLKEIKAKFPVVDYSGAEIDDPARKAKSKKYGRIPIFTPDATGDKLATAVIDWEVGLPALPVEKSQLIIVGKVAEANAFLSDNKTAVYSEFKIEVEKVFKNETTQRLKGEGYVIAERQGGVVRYPSGAETLVMVAGQQMPAVQKRYVFFLSYDFPGLAPQNEDLHIVTAYELADGRVIPLDSPGGGTHPIAREYKGKEVSELFSDLKKALLKSSRKTVKEALP